MKKISFVVLFLAFLISCSCPKKSDNQASGGFVYDAKPEKEGMDTIQLNVLDSVITAFVKKEAIPNAVSFVAKNGKVVFFRAYGWRDMEKKIPLQKDDIFRIASQTKAIVSVAFLTLFEKGMFLLDDPVSKYIPEFKNPMVLEKINLKDTSWTSRPAKREITIRDLLRHTSGISYGNEIYDKFKIPRVNSTEKVTAEEISKKLAKIPLAHDPGEAWTYGMNIEIIGYLCEIFSGKPLDKFLKETIFEPLEMNNSFFYLPEDKANRLVTLYSKDTPEGKLYPAKGSNQNYPISGARTYFTGGAGLVGSIEDYAKFCQMLLNGGNFNNKRIIGRKTVDLMTTNQIGDKTLWDSGNTFGLGFEIVTEKGSGILPASVGAYRWGGMYHSDYVIDPKEKLVALIYTNVYPFPAPDLNRYFRNLIYSALK